MFGFQIFCKMQLNSSLSCFCYIVFTKFFENIVSCRENISLQVKKYIHKFRLTTIASYVSAWLARFPTVSRIRLLWLPESASSWLSYMREKHLADFAVFDNILINMRADIHSTVHSTFCFAIKATKPANENRLNPSKGRNILLRTMFQNFCMF